MDVTVNSQILAQELRIINRVVPTKATLPVLANVLLKTDDPLSGHHLHFAATDLEIAFQSSCKATVHDAGAITLPAKRLLDLVERMPDSDVHLVVQAGQVHVSCGTFTSRLQTLPATEFPMLPAMNGEALSIIPAAQLRAMLERVRYAIAEKSGQYVTAGALLSLTDAVAAMVATDGKRLSVATLARSAPGPTISAIIPTKTIDALLSQIEDGQLQFCSTDRHLFFFLGNDRLLISRMLDQTFPSYERIIPKDSGAVATVNRSALASALRRIGIVSPDNHATKFTFETNRLTMQAESAQVGDAHEDMVIQYTGAPITIWANWEFILQFLEAAREATITIAIKDTESPLLLQDGTNFLNVIMGIRV